MRHGRRTRVWTFAAVLVVLALALVAWIGGAVPTTASGAGDPVIAAAGDIACDPASPDFHGGLGTSHDCRQLYTSNLLTNAGLAQVLPLGDEQYECGSYAAFLHSYDLSWGRVKALSRPVPGNHEYLTSGGGTGCSAANAGAHGYFKYFGAAAGNPKKGYYSYNTGGWHIIALNSECADVGGCGATNPQGRWLAADLAAAQQPCTLAYWHIPLFSSGSLHSAHTLPFWKKLYAAHADIVLNGHEHFYERFAPQNPSGAPDGTNGIREFIVGTGGANHTPITSIAPNSAVRNDTAYGVLKLTLHLGGYDWEFVPAAGSGSFTDSGSATCHPKKAGPGSRTLSVSRSGGGSGTVSSAPAGISCGSLCSHAFAVGTPVALTATHRSGSVFAGWSGDCTGTGKCTLTMSRNHSVTAVFEKKCIVPDVRGRKLRAARRAIRRAHCSVGHVRKRFAKKVKKRRVISQKPKAGAHRPPGAKVKLVVSKGKRR
jgi:PASTA domain-containing protein/List-Bact-rpt repeat protein/calcineurin-like phosphoesterase family protein